MSTISSTSATSPYDYLTASQTSTNPLLQNLNSLGTALQSGDSDDVSDALSALQNTVASNSSSTTQPFGSNTQANTDYNNLVTAVQSGNTTDAQNALTQLQSTLKSSKSGHAHGGHSHHGGGKPPATTDTTATDTTSSTPNNDGSGSVINVTV